ncbi:MAG: hypothetical protein IIV51_08975 [Lachnospiraceae bacterium]|nr:hypothetical protein [Lachnospiraceae bacterium]
MITEKLRKAIANRAATDDEWDYGVQQSWKEILSIISESLDDIVDFVENDCTADEFSWLSEIYNEIIDVFPSKRIITALRKTASKYPDEVKKFNLDYCIDEAEGHLEFLLTTIDSNKSN